MYIYPCCNLNIFRNENSKLSQPYLTKTFRQKKFPSHPPYLVSYVWVKSNDEKISIDQFYGNISANFYINVNIDNK